MINTPFPSQWNKHPIQTNLNSEQGKQKYPNHASGDSKSRQMKRNEEKTIKNTVFSLGYPEFLVCCYHHRFLENLETAERVCHHSHPFVC